MNSRAPGVFYRLAIPLLILMAACSLSPSIPLTGGNGYHFDGLSGKAQERPATASYQSISKWTSNDISYYFINGTDQLPGDTEQNVIKQAFALWAAQAPLTFTQVSDQSQADIVIGWAAGDHGDGDPFDGPGDVLAHSSFPNPYNDRQVFLHFDDDEHWVDSTTGDVDLETVAAHEIGHTLGLDHSDDPNALMYPSYEGPHRSLGSDDIAGIQDLYGPSSNLPPARDVPGNQVPPASNGQDGIEVQNRINPLHPDMEPRVSPIQRNFSLHTPNLCAPSWTWR
jgi:hypothetical protein